MDKFASKLKELRIENELKQKDLAKAINSTQRTISNWEKNISEPSIEMIHKLCHYFQVSADYLLGLSDY